MHKIVLAGNITEDAKQRFYTQCAGRYQLVEILKSAQIPDVKDAEYIVTRGIPFRASEIAQLQSTLRLIHRWGVGFDSVDVEAAGKKGIAVAVCTGGNAQPVAEMSVLLMLASYRKLIPLLNRAKEGVKDKEDIIAQSYLLQGKLVGLLGLGNIGSRVSKILKGFGVAVQYYDAFRGSPEMEKELGVTYVPFTQLLKTSDIVSIHVPLVKSTAHMMGEKEFELMKPSALLVNTARGGIIDTAAMLAALDTGKIAAAALDTIEGEPLPPEHPIFSNPKILLTPHGAGNTCDNTQNMVDIIIQNIDAMESGQLPAAKYIVNAKYLNH